MSRTFPDLSDQHSILFTFFDSRPEFSPEAVIDLTGHVKPPAVNVIPLDPVLSHLTEIICRLFLIKCKLWHHPLIAKALIARIGFRILRTYHRIFQPVKPVLIVRCFSFFHNIIESHEVPSTMIENTINDNTDPFFMAVLHQFSELFIRTKAGIDMIVVQKVIFMIFPCCKDRVDINGIDTKLRQIIYVFCDPLYSSSKLSMNLFLSIVLLCFHSADKTMPGGKAVRKNIIDHGILYPLRRRHDICPVIKRKLVIL